MLIPANIALEGVVGGKFDAAIQLFADDAHTIPFDLSGYNANASVFEVDGVAILAVGSGLTVDAGTSTFTARMTSAQTAAVTANGSKYRLKLLPAVGTDADFPVYGQISWTVP